MLWNTQVHLGDSSVDMWSKVRISRIGPFTLIWFLISKHACDRTKFRAFWLCHRFCLQTPSATVDIFGEKNTIAKSTKHCSLGWPRDCPVHLAQGLIESPCYGETRSHKRALQRDSSMFRDSKWNGSPAARTWFTSERAAMYRFFSRPGSNNMLQAGAFSCIEFMDATLFRTLGPVGPVIQGAKPLTLTQQTPRPAVYFIRPRIDTLWKIFLWYWICCNFWLSMLKYSNIP